MCSYMECRLWITHLQVMCTIAFFFCLHEVWLENIYSVHPDVSGISFGTRRKSILKVMIFFFLYRQKLHIEFRRRNLN